LKAAIRLVVLGLNKTKLMLEGNSRLCVMFLGFHLLVKYVPDFDVLFWLPQISAQLSHQKHFDATIVFQIVGIMHLLGLIAC
jgi:hypothetical protein